MMGTEKFLQFAASADYQLNRTHGEAAALRKNHMTKRIERQNWE
jgi:hypothetical protein